jgi:hypothetical protein
VTAEVSGSPSGVVSRWGRGEFRMLDPKGCLFLYLCADVNANIVQFLSYCINLFGGEELVCGFE